MASLVRVFVFMQFYDHFKFKIYTYDWSQINHSKKKERKYLLSTLRVYIARNTVYEKMNYICNSNRDLKEDTYIKVIFVHT